MFNLLSDYIGFIKKALVLLKVYHVIKRVELEVQETEDPSPEESIPPISGSIIVKYQEIGKYEKKMLNFSR